MSIVLFSLICIGIAFLLFLGSKLGIFKKIAVFSLAGVGASAFATGPDFTAVTTAIDWSTVITGVLAVATAAAGVYIAIKGAKFVLGALKGL